MGKKLSIVSPEAKFRGQVGEAKVVLVSLSIFQFSLCQAPAPEASDQPLPLGEHFLALLTFPTLA